MSADAFWTFSVAFYDRPGVSAACLLLQDEHGADVDLVLFALWCAARGCRLDAAALVAAENPIVDWRSRVVRAIRHARRALQPPPGPPFDPEATDALRHRLLAAELDAERLQHAAMATFAPPPGSVDATTAARDNLACLAQHAGIPPDAAPLRTLLGAFG